MISPQDALLNDNEVEDNTLQVLTDDATSKYDQETHLFIGDLSKRCTDDHLIETFSKWGTVR